MKVMPTATEDEWLEQEVEKAMNETKPVPPATDEATKTLQRMFSDAANGFSDRRIELENEIAVRQAELADIKVAIESVAVALKSIEAGVSLKQSPVQKQGQTNPNVPNKTIGVPSTAGPAR